MRNFRQDFIFILNFWTGFCFWSSENMKMKLWRFITDSLLHFNLRVLSYFLIRICFGINILEIWSGYAEKQVIFLAMFNHQIQVKYLQVFTFLRYKRISFQNLYWRFLILNTSFIISGAILLWTLNISIADSNQIGTLKWLSLLVLFDLKA